MEWLIEGNNHKIKWENWRNLPFHSPFWFDCPAPKANIDQSEPSTYCTGNMWISDKLSSLLTEFVIEKLI